jgi:hypothetical protein
VGSALTPAGRPLLITARAAHGSQL